MAKIDINKLREYESKGLLRSQTHPKYDLIIWNYSVKTQFERLWDDITLQCRGLVTDSRGNIHGRCMPKFFNLGELDEIPQGNYRIFTKADGSLIQAFRYEGEVIITSKGSFTSEQAVAAKRLLDQNGVVEGFTYAFELIGPDNRIVVDYSENELILLAVIRNRDGKDLDIEQLGLGYVYRTVAEHVYDCDITELKDRILDTEEGFVILFENGERLKIKGENYLRLHKIITNTSSRDIWRMLRDNEDVMEYVENVPDEFYKWFRMTVGTLFLEFRAIKQQAQRDWDYAVEKGLIIPVYSEVEHWGLSVSRKEIAKYFQTCQYPKLMFALLDNRFIEPMIWNMIEPKYEKAFML